MRAGGLSNQHEASAKKIKAHEPKPFNGVHNARELKLSNRMCSNILGLLLSTSARKLT